MTPALCECQKRNDLQHRVWDLVSRFHILTSHLFSLAGGSDPLAFASTKANCAVARADIVECRRQLQVHRAEHGC